MELKGERWQLKKKKEREEEKRQEPQAPPAQARRTGPFGVAMTADAIDGYGRAPGNVRDQIDGIMERLKAWPEVSGTRTLWGKGWAPGKYRMKTGDWRVEFYVDETDRAITILRIGHRDDFYGEYHD